MILPGLLQHLQRNRPPLLQPVDKCNLGNSQLLRQHASDGRVGPGLVPEGAISASRTPLWREEDALCEPEQVQKAVVVAIGQWPLPVTGFSLVTARATVLLREAGHHIIEQNTAGSARLRGFQFHLSRSARVLRAVACLWRKRAHAGIRCDDTPVGLRYCYIACDGGLGIIYALLLVIVARSLRYSIRIHHHSFDYVDRWRLLMWLLLRLAGSTARHVVLCRQMATGLGRYRCELSCAVVSNAAFVAPSWMRLRTARPLSIGLLGNINTHKGLYDFLALIRAARAEGIELRGVLAGGVAAAPDRVAVHRAKIALGALLDVRGPVDGWRKDEFFADIDILTLPTRYAHEAQPLVIAEAMAHGVPVVAFDRGGIAAQVGEGGFVVARDGDFVTETLAFVIAMRGSPAAFHVQRMQAWLRARGEHKRARAAFLGEFPSASIPAPAEVKRLTYEGP